MMNEDQMKRFRIFSAALVIAVALGTAYATKFGLYPRYFDIAWYEELQLHDGRVVVMHVKETYERRGFRINRYANTTFRKNEFEFDPGSGQGAITFTSRLGVRSIDQVSGTWYVVLFGQGPYGNFPEEMPDHWGMDYSVSEERLGKLIAKRFQPVAWDEAPAGTLKVPNRIVGSLPLEVLAQFDGRLITLADKKRLRDMYPPGPGAMVISRPIRMQSKSQG
jgi:hypothetical protein